MTPARRGSQRRSTVLPTAGDVSSAVGRDVLTGGLGPGCERATSVPERTGDSGH